MMKRKSKSSQNKHRGSMTSLSYYVKVAKSLHIDKNGKIRRKLK